MSRELTHMCTCMQAYIHTWCAYMDAYIYMQTYMFVYILHILISAVVAEINGLLRACMPTYILTWLAAIMPYFTLFCITSLNFTLGLPLYVAETCCTFCLIPYLFVVLPEKERYFAGFQGSNELDIKIRNEKREQKSLTGMPPVPADGTLQRSTRNTIQESFMVERIESNTMRSQ